MGLWAREFLLLPSVPWSKRQIPATFNLTHAVLDSTRPSTDGETSVHFSMEVLDHWQEVGLFDFNWQGKSSPFSRSRSISLKYLVYTHSSAAITGPVVCWVCLAVCRAMHNQKGGIKARNNYSGLCVGEWRRWKAHCQLCMPAVARAKRFKGWGGRWGG